MTPTCVTLAAIMLAPAFLCRAETVTTPSLSSPSSETLADHQQQPPQARTPIDWQVAPATVYELQTPGSAKYMDMHFSGPASSTHPDSLLAQYLPEIEEQRDELDPFFRDSTLDLTFRSAYFREEHILPDPPDSTAWAMGGNLIYTSGWWQDFLKIGAGYYTSNGIYKPYGKGGTNLLRDDPPTGGQHNINVLGQAYVELKYEQYHAKFYRQALDTPFINEHYVRMLPQLFEAYVIGTKDLLYNTNETGLATMRTLPFNFLAGYVREELNTGESAFNSMSAIATDHRTSEDRGVAFGGVQVAPVENLNLSLWEYYGVDMFNTVYVEGEYVLPLENDPDGWAAKFAVQFIDQRSVGSKLAGDWSGQSVGALAGIGKDGFIMTLRFTYNFDGVGTAVDGNTHAFGIASPWGRYPGFNKSTVTNFNGSDAAVLGIGASYDFGHLDSSLDGLELASSYVYQFSKSTGAAAHSDIGEFDIVMSYEAPFLKGLRLDVLTSWVSFYNRSSNPPAINDYRVILNYTLALL